MCRTKFGDITSVVFLFWSHFCASRFNCSAVSYLKELFCWYAHKPKAVSVKSSCALDFGRSSSSPVLHALTISMSPQVEDRDYLEKVSGSIFQTLSLWEIWLLNETFSFFYFTGIPSSFCLDRRKSHVLGWDVFPERKWRDDVNCRCRNVFEGNQGNYVLQ